MDSSEALQSLKQSKSSSLFFLKGDEWLQSSLDAQLFILVADSVQFQQFLT